MFEIRRYRRADGNEPFTVWFGQLGERQAKARIIARLDRLENGNLGDCKSLRGGLFELRIDWGPGYRVYFGRKGNRVVILLSGGDKRRQTADIERAIGFWKDYQRRSSKDETR